MPLILIALVGCPLVTDADLDDAMDRDGDGFAALAFGGDDCNDDDPRTYPGAPDPWYDGTIYDCDRVDDFDADLDGLVRDDDCDDTDPDVAGPTEWWVDADFDNAGAGSPITDCDPGPGWAPVGGDCDDANSNLHPLASERCNGVDDDCDGFVDDDDPTVDPAGFVTTWRDDDGDGVGVGDPDRACVPPPGWALVDGDCDDEDPNNTPGSAERCDGVDNDCDGLVDDDDSNLDAAEATWYLDDDGDGFGDDATADTLLRCLGNANEVNVGGDCNDDEPDVFPTADEICNGIDDDCDGVLDASDPDVVLPVWYLDADGDGIGDEDFPAAQCLAPTGYVSSKGDCDDTRADIGGPVAELQDADGDGYGSVALVVTCDPDPDAVTEGGDCNDDDATIHPGMDEVYYDGVDQDCSGTSDYDADQDGQDSVDYNGDDCDDDDPDTYDGAAEIWYDGKDQDCRGGSDDDADGDGYDALSQGGTDCDDTDPLTWPDAPEIWGDGIDQDCGLFDDLDVDMDGVPDMDGCATVARVDVPGDYGTLAAAIAGAADCTDIHLGSGVHQAVDLDVGSRRILVRSDVDDAALQGINGSSMFLTAGFLGVANLEAYGSGSVVTADTARVVFSDMYVHDTELEAFTITFDDDAVGDLWMRFSTFEANSGFVTADAGTFDIRDVVALDSEEDFNDRIDVRECELVVERFHAEGGEMGELVGAAYCDVTLRDITMDFVDSGATFSITESSGLIERVVIRNSITDEMRLHADGLGTLTVRDFRVQNNQFSPFFSYGLVWLEGVIGDHIEVIGNDITGGGFAAVNVDVNGDGSELSHILIAGNEVDIGIQCDEPTPMQHAVVTRNSGDGVVWRCQPSHSIVADNEGRGMVDVSGVQYTDVYGHTTNFALMTNPVGINGNVSIDPGFQTVGPTIPPAYLDVHLRPTSLLRDAGDPTLFDVDGTVADIGYYGGPDGEDDLLDSDGDGMPDVWERSVGLDPAIDDALEDPDGDELDNLGEFVKGTRPDVPDTDSDQVDDDQDDFPLDASDA